MKLTVIIRDDSPMIHCGDSPSYRTLTIAMEKHQLDLLLLEENEKISRAILEPNN